MKTKHTSVTVVSVSAGIRSTYLADLHKKRQILGQPTGSIIMCQQGVLNTSKLAAVVHLHLLADVAQKAKCQRNELNPEVVLRLFVLRPLPIYNTSYFAVGQFICISDMRRLTTGILFEKCVVRRLRVPTQTQIVQCSLLNISAIWYSLLLLGYKPVQHVTVLNTVGNCNTKVSIVIL